MLCVFFIAMMYVLLPHGNSSVISANLAIDNSFVGSHGILGFGSSLVCCLWAFDGFSDANFLQEELSNPIRDLPTIVSNAVAIVTACYLLINVAYLSVMTKDKIINTSAVSERSDRLSLHSPLPALAHFHRSYI